jgi:hypothetical protein
VTEILTDCFFLVVLSLYYRRFYGLFLGIIYINTRGVVNHAKQKLNQSYFLNDEKYAKFFIVYFSKSDMEDILNSAVRGGKK